MLNTTKREIKREKIQIQILSNKSDPEAKFEVFIRLNTGGSFLSYQEVRNCLLLMLNKSTFEWFNDISNDSNFLTSINISDRRLSQRYETELATRFFALVKYDYKQNDVSEFLDKTAKSIASDHTFDYSNEKSKFCKIFEKLNEALGEDVFKKFNNGKHVGQFMESAFEAITYAAYNNYDLFIALNDLSIKSKIQNLWSNPDFSTNIGSGSNAKTRIPKMIGLKDKVFNG